MTPMEDFQDLLPSMPDASRVWMFGAQRFLTPDEANHLQAEMSHFVSGWQAHGKDLLAGFWLLLNNVLVVAVDESKEPPSGCSIDKVFKLLKSQQEKIIIKERHEAWENLARKLAHEIKNPLTPIQLTIDKLKNKYFLI